MGPNLTFPSDRISSSFASRGDDQASAATFAALRAELELPKGVRFTTVQLQGAAIRQQARASTVRLLSTLAVGTPEACAPP